jgi:hypothetical protein
MDGLFGAFESLTAPQAEVISSATTLLSALLVAIVAPLTFHLLTRGGVKGFNEAVGDLKIAADRAKTQSDTIGGSMGTIASVSARVNELGVLLASVQEALANTQNTLLEGERTLPDGEIRESLRALWRTLQERVEQAASNPKIHGRTRARYARMDRRSYLNLIETLLDDGNLAGEREVWREAYGIWASAKNRTKVGEDELSRMRVLEAALRDVIPMDGAEGDQEVATATTSASPPTEDFRQALRRPLPKSPRRLDGEQPTTH